MVELFNVRWVWWYSGSREQQWIRSWITYETRKKIGWGSFDEKVSTFAGHWGWENGTYLLERSHDEQMGKWVWHLPKRNGSQKVTEEPSCQLQPGLNDEMLTQKMSMLLTACPLMAAIVIFRHLIIAIETIPPESRWAGGPSKVIDRLRPKWDWNYHVRPLSQPRPPRVDSNLEKCQPRRKKKAKPRSCRKNFLKRTPEQYAAAAGSAVKMTTRTRSSLSANSKTRGSSLTICLL